MNLPVQPPFPPMEANTAPRLPAGEEWQYEPKWDGFRALAFRDRVESELQSKSTQSLTRYFPELIDALSQVTANRFVLDGEIMVPSEEGYSFDALLQRIHPAASRVRKLSVETPAILVVFDLLLDERSQLLTGHTTAERRERLENFFERYLEGSRFVLSPATRDRDEALRWWDTPGVARDGVIAKRADLPYMSGARTGMLKVKKLRTADCVVGGFRYDNKGKHIGSLLLGLYDDDGLLHHVGFTSSFRAQEKAALTERVKRQIGPPGFTGRAPGGPSRWSTEKSTEWTALRPELVVEVQYDHFTNGRFRHGTKLLRWRPDKAPEQCTFQQIAR